MARLLINPGSPAAWEVRLKPGTNRLGRGFANDFKIEDPSVSGSHCEIVLNDGRATITDLGSTNGTFINRAPVQEAALEAGQTIHMGGVEMVFHSDSPEQATVNETEVLPLPPIAKPVVARIVAPPIPGPMEQTGTDAALSGSQNCKFHPKTLGRFLCNHCKLFFCELCVTSRAVGGAQHKFCRRCGAECLPVKVQLTHLIHTKGFFQRLPGVFLYPSRGSGLFVLIVCTIVLFALDFISRGWLAIFAKMAFFGYLFSFMQNIIHSTAAGDEEMPGWPNIDDLFGCFLRLAGAVTVSFGPAIALFFVAFFSEETTVGTTFMIPALVLGCLCFPMALLAVAMKDTPLAANPLVVLPAIFKAPLEYLVTVLLLAAIMGLRAAGGPVIDTVFPRGLGTHSMPKLFAYLGSWTFWNFAEVYLLAVNMRILGLLYLTKKEKLAWFDH
jgi:pSer/pThr/pTyr-binding forkhead associated (FHA) protein